MIMNPDNYIKAPGDCDIPKNDRLGRPKNISFVRITYQL